MKTYTTHHRDAPQTPLDRIREARKEGRWADAGQLITAEAKRQGIITDETIDMAKMPLALLSEWCDVMLGAEKWDTAESGLLLLAAAAGKSPDQRKNMPKLWRKIGQCFEVNGKYENALAAYKNGIDAVQEGADWGDDSRLWIGYGANLFRLGRESEGEDAWRKSLRRKCTSAEAKYSRAQVQLCLGQYEEGWRLWESRKELPGHQESLRARGGVPNLPEWDGKTEGRVLCLAGQGAGDVIMFSRYLKQVDEASGNITRVRPGDPLAKLLAPWGDLGGEEYVAHLDSMPLLLRAPEPIPPHCTRPWARPSNTKPRVGYCFRGSPRHLNDKDRSKPKGMPVPHSPEWEMVDLEHGRGLKSKDYQETAELMRTLDAVWCVDTSVVHVAGTLGVPTVLIPPAACEWRWGLRSEATPWYPSVKIIRRKTVYDWADALLRGATKIEEMLG